MNKKNVLQTEIFDEHSAVLVADFKKQPTMDFGVVGADTDTAVVPVLDKKLSGSHNFLYYDSDLIVIQNRLLHAISRLNLNERRLILFLSVIVRLERLQNPNKKDFFIKAVDFAKEYDLGTKSIYRTFASIAKSIQFKPFFYWSFDENSYNEWGSAWFSDCGYLKEQGGIKVVLSDTVIEMLTVFNRLNPFTKYQKEWIAKLGSYGIVLLELAVWRLNESKSDKCMATFTLEYLREKFDCVNSYARFDDFRTRVIDKAIKDIHYHTPLRVSYERQGRGKKISDMTFIFENLMFQEKEDKSIDFIELESKNEKNNPFYRFKMTQKQLSFFANKIKKHTGQSIDEIIDELCNVHLQGKHIEFLQSLDFVPSGWYNDDEIKKHLTAEQIAQENKKVKQKSADKKNIEKKQLEKDFEILLENAEVFVLANQHLVNRASIEGVFLKDKDYLSIVRMWKDNLLDKSKRQYYKLVDEILRD